MVIVTSQALLCENRRNPATKCYPSDLYMVMSYWFCLNDLRARLKWCRNKRWFKDIPSNRCLHISERRSLDLSGWGPRFNTYWGNILLLEIFFFFVVKPLMPILPKPILSVCEKLEYNAVYPGCSVEGRISEVRRFSEIVYRNSTRCCKLAFIVFKHRLAWLK